MISSKAYNQADVLIVGAGPAGLAAGIVAKLDKPDLDVVVVDKAESAGNHNLSGAALEPDSLHRLLDRIKPDWRESDEARAVLGRKAEKDDVLFLPNGKLAFNIHWQIKMARKFKINMGQMYHHGDYLVSISQLTAWLSRLARDTGVEVLYGFAVRDIHLDTGEQAADYVQLVDQGLDKEGHKQQNYLEGEKIYAKMMILAEGCDGLLTEKFIADAGLTREHNQLYSIGVKEVIKVSDEQYRNFSDNRCVHALGYPIFIPPLGPDMFGGGVLYPMGDNKIAVGMIVGLDFKYCDFNPQDALVRFKEHPAVKKYIEGGMVTEAGAKMIPEAGYYGIPRDPGTQSIGKTNVAIVGDSAGLVNMIKIKGLHNAIESGMQAGAAAAQNLETPKAFARAYTRLLEHSPVIKELLMARNFRQTVGKLGPMFGIPMSVLGGLLPRFTCEKDYECMTSKKYPLRPDRNFDKDTFTAVAATQHREEEPSHLTILDESICMSQCKPKYNRPCITFCPAGVYETVHDEVKPANPSNCLHCKTCQRKCPFDNIRWTVPEGGGGPRYKTM